MKVQLGRSEIVLPLVLFILSFALYSHTLAPTITWQHDGYDGGDLITAAHTLGIPHPTGYPTYMLLGKLFTLLPIGDVAHRMNLLSALCAALTIMLLYSASATLLHPQPSGQTALKARPYAEVASACAALFLGTSRIFWSQAVITEVYTLNSLFFTAILYLLLKIQQHPSEWPENLANRARIFHMVMLAVLMYGLSLGNHLTMAFSAPLLLFSCTSVFRHHALRAWQWACVLATFLLGLSIYLYLPLRAGSQTLLNWGNPSTWRGFLWLVSGGMYRQYVLALPLAYWGQRLMAWAGLLRQQFGIWGIALGLLGAWKQAERSPQQFAIVVLTFIIYSGYALSYNTTDSYVYLLPVYFLYALWLAQGAQYILSTLASMQSKWSKAMAGFLCLALLALPLGLLRMNLPVVDLSNDYTAYNYGSQVFTQVPDGSIIISASDAHTFTLWYFARVVTGRTGVALIDRDLLGYDWYVNGLRLNYPWLNLPPASTTSPLSIDRLLEANIQSYAIFLTDMDAGLASGYSLRQEGIIYQLLAH